MGKIVFLTGTDTGVGKTLLTLLLLGHARAQGVHALAMKPFCSGSKQDIKLLHEAQRGDLTEEEINPYFTIQPLAPFAAGSKRVPLRQVVARINRLAEGCDLLLVEGIGGVMVPLGGAYFVGDLIGQVACSVLLVARNQLGTINHTLLSRDAIAAKCDHPIKIVLMEQKRPDLSAETNCSVLQKLCSPTKVIGLPYLGGQLSSTKILRTKQRKIEKTLARLLGAN